MWTPKVSLGIFLCLLSLCCRHHTLVESIAPPYYGLDRPSLEYELPPLSFGYEGLEPYMDSETLKGHYLGHHAKYTENMNNALREWRRAVDRMSIRVSIIDILRNLSHIPPKFREPIKNYGGGYVNHALVWACLSPNSQGEDRWPRGPIADDIKTYFRSFIHFRDIFSDAAQSVFGSGYAWLCRNKKNEKNPRELKIVTTSNQDSPLSQGLYPILAIDVWEHAYYLKHRNQRTKYIQEWWYLVDWDNVKNIDDFWLGIKQHDEL